MQELGQVEKICDAPLTCRQPNQARPHLLGHEQLAEHRGEAAVTPSQFPIGEAIEPGLSFWIVLFEGEELVGVETDQGRGQRSFEQAIAPGIEDALEKPLQFARFFGGEDASITLHHASDASLAEGGLEHLRLTMSANENGHVAVAKGVLSQVRTGRRQRGDVVTYPAADKFELGGAGPFFGGSYQPKAQRSRRRR